MQNPAAKAVVLVMWVLPVGLKKLEAADVQDETSSGSHHPLIVAL